MKEHLRDRIKSVLDLWLKDRPSSQEFQELNGIVEALKAGEKDVAERWGVNSNEAVGVEWMIDILE